MSSDQPPAKGSSQPLRSSDRERNPPTFFGNPISHAAKARNKSQDNTQDKPARNTAVKPKSTTGSATQSFRSIMSNSTLRKTQIELKSATEIAEIKATHRKRREEFDKMQVDAKELAAQIVDFQNRQADTPCGDLNKEWYTTKITEKKTELASLESDIAAAAIRLKYEYEEVEEQLKILELNAKLKIAEIDDDEAEEIENLQDIEKRKDLEAFVTKSAQRLKIKPVDPHSQRCSSESEEEDEAQKPQGKVPENNSFESIAQAFVKAMKDAIPSSSSGSTDKVLARQVQGKDLPPFSGKSSEWPAFINAYETSTTNCQFTDAENLLRLQRCLKGEAMKTVQCLLINAASVPQVIQTLRMCFGRPGMIVNSMITAVKETPYVQYNKPETWVEFGVAVNNLVSTIKSLKATEQMANPSLVHELVQKLPPVSQMDWMKHTSLLKLEFPKLEDFADWLRPNTEASFMLRSEKTFTEKPQGGNRRFNRNTERGMVSTERNENNSKRSSASNQQFSKGKCFICDTSDHKSRDCPQFKAKKVDERWEMAKKSKACFGCIGRGHSFMQCKTKKICGINRCEKQHCRLLHSDNPPLGNKEKEKAQEQVKMSQEMTSPAAETENCKVAQGNNKNINYLVVPAFARNSKRELVPIFLAFDGYSSFTATSAETAKRLGLKGIKKPFTVKGFQATTTVSESYVIEIEVESKSSQYKYTFTNVKTVPNLDLPSQALPQKLINQYSHLRNLDLEPYDEIVPTILVGMDHYEQHFHLDIVRGQEGEPAAIKTAFGWALFGYNRDSRIESHSFKMTEVTEDPLHHLVKYFFTTEAIGVEPGCDRPRSKDDIRAQAIMDRTIKRTGEGWETGLLWREDEIHLPKSKEYALRRLYSSERKMDRDPEYAKEYNEKVETFLEKGFARKLTPEESIADSPTTFYLPHFLAYNEKKSNKYRFVFDAAAKVSGRSLNDHLLQGPDKLASLVGILLQFRQRRIAITADIKDFFPRVKVRQEDCNAQRFLWRGMGRNHPPSVYRMEALIFGAACSPTCAQEAKEMNAREFKAEFPQAYEAISKKHYVDDYLDSCDTEDEMIQLQKEVTEVHSRGSFQLCNWLSNSKKVVAAIPKELHAKSLKAFDGKEDLIERVLGLFWRPETDDFTFQLKFLKAKEEIINGQKVPTKREILSLVMSIFDPLGLISILTVKAKMILQATWRSKIGWDDEIPASTFENWTTWLKELSHIQTFSIPRCYSMNFTQTKNIQLHVFCDASEEAFGAVSYFRIEACDRIETTLVMSKTNVSPLKPLSIPRLELQAALLGARLAKFVGENIEIGIGRVVFWSDSSTVLSWIRADGRRFQQFVATRIGKIQEMTDIIQWKWIPTIENVADEITRFSKPCDWSPTSRWINGPSFLQKSEDLWPKEKQTVGERDETVSELKKEKVFLAKEVTLPCLDSSRFSSWWKLIRSTAYVIRFIQVFVLKKFPKEKSHITINELRTAKAFVIKMAQIDSFPEEILTLKENNQVSRKSKLFKLSPAIQNDLLVVKGRLSNAPSLHQSVKNPIILDPKHPTVRLLLDHYHKLCGHHGQERIANELRQEFYILGMRTAVRSAQSRCQLCKNRRVMPIPPEMGQLPRFRLEGQVRAFIKVGLDYFGPVQIIVKRSNEKRYVALFTCLSTRAVHLELAGSLSSDSCIMALRRFVARRGCPLSIYSDNGTNFVGANAELKTALGEIDQTKIQDFCSLRKIEWNFNPPSAPHMGGSWERMVKSVKTALGDTLQIKKLHEEVLQTLLLEAEHTVNSHPLTHVPDDPHDLEALTPNHFLIGRSSNLQPIGDFSDNDLYGRKQWRVVQAMADQFWKRWTREYLPTLLRRSKWCSPSEPIKVGDVVIEVNNNLPRNTWPKGRVVKLFPGQDKVVRVVDIVLANGHTFRRPVAKLCILDVQDPRQKKIAAPDELV